jgi:hypothetical protein
MFTLMPDATAALQNLVGDGTRVRKSPLRRNESDAKIAIRRFPNISRQTILSSAVGTMSSRY